MTLTPRQSGLNDKLRTQARDLHDLRMGLISDHIWFKNPRELRGSLKQYASVCFIIVTSFHHFNDKRREIK